MKLQSLITILFLTATPVLAQPDNSIDLLRIKAARNIILNIGLETIEAPNAEIAYIRIVAKRVLETGGAFLFNMPEEFARQNFETQIGFQTGVLIGLCNDTSVDVDELIAEGLTETSVRSLCL